MEQVASALEKRISSLNAGISRSTGLGFNSDNTATEGTSQRLLRSASLDSTAGLRSPGTASPSVQEWHSDVVADLRLDGGGAEPRVEPAGSSPFAEASRQPPALEETVVVTPSRVYHGLTRPGGHRHRPQEAGPKPDPAEKWKEQRTLLIFWLVTAVLTLVSSLQWLQVGMWAGLLGLIGPCFSLCDCCTPRKLPLNLQVTRIFAVATSAVSIFAAVLFVFLLIRLHCPHSIRAANSCNLFRVADTLIERRCCIPQSPSRHDRRRFPGSRMAMTALWHTFHAGVAALVSARASRIIAMFEPADPRRILVLRSESQASRVLEPSPSSRRSAAV